MNLDKGYVEFFCTILTLFCKCEIISKLSVCVFLKATLILSPEGN